MKRIKSLLLILASVLLVPSVVNAASASISVSGASTAVVGNRVTLTVKLSSGTSIGSWQMDLDYDSRYLQFTGGGGEAGGMSMVNSSAGGTKAKTYTFTFKALKSGSTNVRVGSYLVYAFNDISEMSVSSGTKSIKIMTQAELEASYSKDNNLKDLVVEGYEITPVFNKDTLEYSVDVPEGTTTINVIATKNDGTATVTGDGALTVTEGTNSFEIVVKAQNGAEKTYKLNVNVIDKNPVEVKIDGKTYTLLKFKATDFICPSTYEESTKKIGEFDVPSCVNKAIKYTIVGLKDEKGKIVFATYKNNKYTLYSELGGTSLSIVPLNYNKDIKGYKKTTIKIDGNKIDAYKMDKDSDFAIVYGLNLLTGKKALYMYNESDKSVMLYNDERVKSLEELNLYLICATGIFGVGLLVSLIGIINISKKKKKKNKTDINIPEVEEENKENDIVEDNTKKTKKQKKEKHKLLEEANEIVEDPIEPSQELEETEVYDIFESEKKSKKKKKK